MQTQTIDEKWLQRVVRSHPAYRADEDGDLVQLARLTCWQVERRRAQLDPALARHAVGQALTLRSLRATRRAAGRPVLVSLDALLTPTDEGADEQEPIDPASGPESISVRSALRAWFDREIAGLPASDAAVVRLRYGWEDGRERSLRDVAISVGRPLPWVQRSLARTHRTLRSACEREGWSPETLLAEVTL